MKKLLLSLFVAGGLSAVNAQTVLFQEDFDGNGPGISAWTVIDVDGNTPATGVAFITNGWNRIDRQGANGNFGGPAGNFAAMSTSWYSPVGTSNDWLISPQVNLTGNPTLVWTSKAQDPQYRDGYKLMLSTNGGNTVADFDVTLYSTAAESSSWVERSVSLADYVGKNIRFAFVNNTTDKFILLVDDIKVVDGNTPPAPPACPTLVSPANGAVDVDYEGGVMFTWTAPSADVTGYDFYLDGELLGDTTSTSFSVTGLQGLTTYSWTVVAKKGSVASENCQEFTFTTAPSAYSPYCGPLTFSGMFGDNIEPITYVEFTGIANRTDATFNGSPAHEIFLDQQAAVMPGNEYTIKLEGNTGGNYTSNFAVFIDWNGNGVFDANETYIDSNLLKVVNSTGTDGQQAVYTISVPQDAVHGVTRMRIKKMFGTVNLGDPCMGATYGQAEDYAVKVGDDMGVENVTKKGLQVYPNPVSDVLNITAEGKVKAVSVLDVNGRVVANYKLDTAKSQVNVSNLATGVYLVQVTTEDGKVQTTKLIKK